MTDSAKFQSSKVAIYADRITYKKLFKGPVTVKYEDVIHMITSFVDDGSNFKLYNLNLFDTKWHNINIRSFSTQTRLEILDYVHDTVTPIVLPKLLQNFDKGNDINLGSLVVNKNIGVVKTNNIERRIKWNDIISMEFSGGLLGGVGFVSIRFKNEDKTDTFEFQFEIRNLRQNDLLISIFEQMIGRKKMIFPEDKKD